MGRAGPGRCVPGRPVLPPPEPNVPAACPSGHEKDRERQASQPKERGAARHPSASTTRHSHGPRSGTPHLGEHHSPLPWTAEWYSASRRVPLAAPVDRGVVLRASASTTRRSHGPRSGTPHLGEHHSPLPWIAEWHSAPRRARLAAPIHRGVVLRVSASTTRRSHGPRSCTPHLGEYHSPLPRTAEWHSAQRHPWLRAEIA
jgi:hypothetical protein